MLFRRETQLQTVVLEALDSYRIRSSSGAVQDGASVTICVAENKTVCQGSDTTVCIQTSTINTKY